MTNLSIDKILHVHCIRYINIFTFRSIWLALAERFKLRDIIKYLLTMTETIVNRLHLQSGFFIFFQY